MDRKQRETAARLYFWLQDVREELSKIERPTRADIRHLLAVKTKGIVVMDRLGAKSKTGRRF